MAAPGSWWTPSSLATSDNFETWCKTTCTAAPLKHDSEPTDDPGPPLQATCSLSNPIYLQELPVHHIRLRAILANRNLDHITEDLRTSNYSLALNEPIAPLFARSNVKRCSYLTHRDGIRFGPRPVHNDLPVSSEIYDRLRPTLELATKWVIASEPFFTKVLFAEQHYDPVCEEVRWLDPSYQTSSSDSQTYLELLPFFQERVTICLGRLQDKKTRERWCCTYGVTCMQYYKGAFMISIQMHEAFLEFFSRKDWDTIDEKLKRRVWFLFAVTMLHEIAHAMMYLRMIMPRAGFRLPVIKELLYETGDWERELGKAWEQWMFGGLVGTRLPRGTNFKDKALSVSYLSYIKDFGIVNWKDFLLFEDGQAVDEGKAIGDDVLEKLFGNGVWDKATLGLNESNDRIWPLIWR